MKASELQDKTKEELIQLLQNKQIELVKTRFAVANRQERNYKKISVIRKDIARIKTRLKAVKN